MEEKVHFYSDCLKLSGTLYLPDNFQQGQQLPGIIGIHGGSGAFTVIALIPVAQRLIQHGYCVLTFFHRGFGDSEGIRSRRIWTEQVRDIRNAVTYMQQRPEVDPDRIGLHGLSLGGATGVYAAAIDERIRCVVEVGGLGDGERCEKSRKTHAQWLEFMDELKEDRIRRVVTGQSKRIGYTTLVPHSPEFSNYMASPESKASFDQEGYPMEIVDDILTFKPESVVHLISPRAVMFVNAERDSMVPAEEAQSLYDKAQEPKNLMILPGASHGDVYEPLNPEVSGQIMEQALEWYGKHL